MTLNGPIDSRSDQRAARGTCRCAKCHALARESSKGGSVNIQWAPINDAVHGDTTEEILKRQAEQLFTLKAELLHKTQLREHRAQTAQAVSARTKRHRHIAGMEMPFSFTFDQAVGAGAGLTISLPMISVFSMTPGVGMVVAMVLTGLGAAAPGLIRKSEDTENEATKLPAAKKKTRKTRLASANEDREAVILAWARYETDVALQIDFPAMTDVRKSETAALAKALRAAEIASRHAGESLEALIRYEDAVLDLEGAFNAAERAAKLDQEHPLTTDQKALAHTLLAMAVDTAGNVHERRQAHQRLLKLLDGVIVLADPAREALAAAARRGEINK